MNIDDLTIGEAKKLAALFGSEGRSKGLCDQVGQMVIVRTYAAGVHFGELEAKDGNEVYLKNSRRMWSWKAAESISLSGCALYGIEQSSSAIAPPIERQWLEAIEILKCSPASIKSISEAPYAKAK